MNPTNAFTYLFGEYSASIVSVLLDADDVRKMLPCDLVPGDPTHPDGKIVVLIGVGRHKGVSLAHLEWLPMFPEEYEEMFIGVPGVHRNDANGAKTQPYHYQPRLYLNQFFPTLGGNLFWGFTKRMARVSFSGVDGAADHSVKSLFLRTPYCELKGTPHGHFGPPSSFPQLEPIRSLLGEIVATNLFFQLGPLALSRFQWHWAERALRSAGRLQTSARIRELADARVHVQSGFLRGLRPGHYHATEALGAMNAVVGWSLFLPRLAPLAAAEAAVRAASR
jgi:Acetoacetate decarboxylase (ADC)